MAEFFRDEWPTSAETWLPAPAPWSLFRNAAVADTYERVLQEAEAAGDRDEQIQAARDAGTAASLPRRSNASCARRRCWTAPAAIAAC